MLRKGYTTQFSIYKDSVAQVAGTYYCVADDKVLPFPSFFNSPQWDNDRWDREFGLGQVAGANVDRLKFDRPVGALDKPNGTPDQFLNGISSEDCICIPQQSVQMQMQLNAVPG
jgi:hypothetical protein